MFRWKRKCKSEYREEYKKENIQRCIEEEVALQIARYIVKKYQAKCELIRLKGNNFVYMHNDKFHLLITVCDTNKKKCIKIEEIYVEKEFRSKKLCTNLIETMKTIAEEENVTLGLWCESNNKQLFNFYSRVGFRYIETLKDDWLEYN